MDVRERKPVDVPTCAELLEAVHAADAYPVQWPSDPEAWLTPAGMICAFVADDSDHLIGHVGLVDRETSVPGFAEVTRLCVSPLRRRSGIGAQLLEVVTAHGLGLGRSLFLEVVEGPSTTTQFYERRRWHLASREPARWMTETGHRPILRRYELKSR